MLYENMIYTEEVNGFTIYKVDEIYGTLEFQTREEAEQFISDQMNMIKKDQ